MPQTVEVKVPDIGDFTDVPVIEVLVKSGDSVKAEDSLVTLESDKATMDVPAPSAGIVREVKVKLGDKVSEGNVILTLESEGANGAKPASPAKSATSVAAAPAETPPATAAPAPGSAAPPQQPAAAAAAPSSASAAPAQAIEVKVPDIGDFKDVPVIEVLVKAGDTVKAEDSLVTLESEKATMDVPSPSAGVIKEMKVKLGDKVSEGHVIAIIESAGAKASAAPAQRRADSGCHGVAGDRGGSCAGKACSERRASSGRSHRRRSLQEGPRLAVRSRAGARAGRGPLARQGNRTQGPRPSGRRSEIREGRSERRSIRTRGCVRRGRGTQPPAVAAGRLHQVRRHRDQAAVADQEAIGREPAPQLGDDPARHQ